MSDFFEGAPRAREEDEHASDDGVGFGRLAEMLDAELDAEAAIEFPLQEYVAEAHAAQVLHNVSGMEAGGLLMMPEPEQDAADTDATGVH